MKNLLKVLGITIALITVGAVIRASVKKEISREVSATDQNLKLLNKMIKASQSSR